MESLEFVHTLLPTHCVILGKSLTLSESVSSKAKQLQ